MQTELAQVFLPHYDLLIHVILPTMLLLRARFYIKYFEVGNVGCER